MHYIQNSWFVINGLWIILIMLVALAVIAYMNNRLALLKKMTVSFVSVFILLVTLHIALPSLHTSVDSTSVFTEKAMEQTQVSSSSIFNSAIDFVLSVLKDKVSD